MKIENKKLVTGILLFLLTVSLSAGDIAEFVNLGFSEEGDYFLFGQYGYEAETTTTYADLFLVDVKNNRFVKNGVHRGNYGSVIEPGQSSNGALFTLLKQVYPQMEEYTIQPLRKGRPLYYRVAGNSDGVNLDFRDFETGIRYKVALNQSVFGEGGDVEASFFLDVTVESQNGKKENYQVGLPELRRTGVREYTIEKVLLSPDGESLVFVISKTIYQKTSPDIRYMVETLSP